VIQVKKCSYFEEERGVSNCKESFPLGSKPCKVERQMKPQQELTSGYQADFFRTELSRMVNPKHPMVKVAAGMDWEAFERALNKPGIRSWGAPG
jgi:hypothetical protein